MRIQKKKQFPTWVKSCTVRRLVLVRHAAPWPCQSLSESQAPVIPHMTVCVRPPITPQARPRLPGDGLAVGIHKRPTHTQKTHTKKSHGRQKNKKNNKKNPTHILSQYPREMTNAPPPGAVMSQPSHPARKRISLKPYLPRWSAPSWIRCPCLGSR